MTTNQSANLLNKNLADLQILIVKLHNYHWNITGIQFRQIHELTENYYEYFTEKYDEVAERIVQLNFKPLASLKEYLENATIDEEFKKEFDSKTVLNSVLIDFQKLNAQYKHISEIAGETSDPSTMGLADNIIAWLEKEIWMLKASLA